MTDAGTSKSSSPIQKKGQTSPKAKGAIRAKSGCYTCRIRRKKCDERADELNRCQTCVRLRLQCLGFGAKRPEWMRGNSSVTDLREKIKTFLASQGMIKGHSGTGPRCAEEDPAILLLNDRASSSTPSPTLRTLPSPSSGSASSPGANGGSRTTSSFARDPPPQRDYFENGHGRSSKHHHSNSGSGGGYHTLGSASSSHLNAGKSSLSPAFTRFSVFSEKSSVLNTSSGNPPSSSSSSYHRTASPTPSASSPSPLPHTQTLQEHQLVPDSPPTRPGPLPDLMFFSPQPSGTGSTTATPSSASSTSSTSTAAAAQILGSSSSLVNPNWTLGQLSLKSSFSALYNTCFDEEGDLNDIEMGGAGDQEYALTTAVQAPMVMTALPFVTPFFVAETSVGSSYITTSDPLVKHYLLNVRQKQYILMGSTIAEYILNLARFHEPSYNAMCWLAAVHRNRSIAGPVTGGEGGNEVSNTFRGEEQAYHEKTQASLKLGVSRPGGLTEGDAMASLHAVSSCLFGGGRGPWDYFLGIACQWVNQELMNVCSQSNNTGASTFFLGHYDTINGLRYMSEHKRFMISTTMWFDVVASVTKARKPFFYDVYRSLFSVGEQPHSKYVDEIATILSIRNVMGCDNLTFWAIADISALAEWKEHEEKAGKLSIPELVRRGKAIENTLSQVKPTPVFGGEEDMSEYGQGEEQFLEHCRRLTSDVFRAAAVVYLHNVLSGDQPGCIEIVNGVRETIRALERVPPTAQDVSRSVVRSVVFPICLAGCLTNDTGARDFFYSKLREQEAESVGNCSEVHRLMRTVWQRRDEGRPAGWRTVMAELGTDLLLLV